jgi:hypothetical protein
MSNVTTKKLFLPKFETEFTLKYFTLIISLMIMISGFIAIIVGSMRLFEGVMQIIGLCEGGNKPGIHIIEAVDTYLFSLVILVLVVLFSNSL